MLTAQSVNVHDKCISLDDQQVRVEQSLEATPAGQTLSVTLRPESVTLSKTPTGQANTLHGTIDEIYFLGSVVRIRVLLTTQYVNVDTFNNPNLQLPAPGEPITLNFAAEACTILRDEPVGSGAKKPYAEIVGIH